MENYHMLFPDGSSSATIENHHQSYLQVKDVAMDVVSDHHQLSHDDEVNIKAGKKLGGDNSNNSKSMMMRKHKYAFQTRSQVDILDDGYRWRKYGQKTVKNSKFPRSYYRCTHKECNVKKQVQRSSKDDEIVVTTYEGKHTHPVEKFTENFEHILTQMQAYSIPL